MQQEKAVDWVKLDFEQARAKHLLFKARLRSLIYGADIDEGPVVSHLDCTVGKWIYGRGMAAYGNIPEMQQLERVHKDLHQEANKLVTLYKSGKEAEARKQMPSIEAISENVNQLLYVIEKDVQQRDPATYNDGALTEALNVNLLELQELLRLNEGLDRRIQEQSKDLYQANERFEMVAKATQDVIWDWDLATNSLWWSDGIGELFGYTAEVIEPTIDSWYNRLHPDDRERVINGIHDVIDKGQKHWSAEYRFRRGDGSYAVVLDRSYAMHDKEGNPCRMLGSMQDVTERRQAEEALRVSEERLKKVLSIETVGVIYFDLEGGIHDANPAFQRMSGYTNNELVSGSVRWDQLTPPEFMEVTLRSKKEFLTKWQNTPYEKQYIRPDGSRWWGLFAGKRLSENECVEFVVDITATKQVEEELERKVGARTVELERRNNELEQFTYVSHHDLQEPLRKIMLFTEMVKEDSYANLSDGSQKRLDRVSDAARRMSIALRDVLNYASLGMEEQLVQTDLDDVLAAVQTDLELLIAEKGAQIRAGKLPTIKAIPRQMHQLFYNLINNALKFSKGNEMAAIRVQCNIADKAEMQTHPDLDSSKDYYQITVQDNGIGFSPEQADKIFNMFQRLHNQEAYAGTGIGLALCKKVVLNHGGKLWAESRAGAGATFHILLPAQ